MRLHRLRCHDKLCGDLLVGQPGGDQLQHFLFARRQDDRIAYVQSLPIQELQEAPATLVVLLKQARMKTLLSNTRMAKGGNVFVLDNQRRLLFTTSSYEEWKSFPFDAILQAKGIYEQQWNHKR